MTTPLPTAHEAIAYNLIHAMGVYAVPAKGGYLRHYPGVSVVSSGLDVAVFNAAMLSAATAGPLGAHGDLRRRVTIAQVHFRQAGTPWSFWLCEDMLDDADRRATPQIMRDHGLRVTSRPAGMCLDTLLPPVRPLPPLDIRPIADPRSRLTFCELSSLVFQLPFPTALEVYDRDSLWRSETHPQGVWGYLGYVDGRAVTGIMLVASAAEIGVYSVGTLPLEQRKGYAEAILRYALRQVQPATGLTRVVLQSTRAGHSLYARIGFRDAARFSVWVADTP